jgi:PAS domain S-box-containing protein
MDASTGSILGTIAVIGTAMLGLLQLVIKGRYDIDKAKTEWRLESVEKESEACRKREVGQENVINNLQVKIASMEAAGSQNYPKSFTLYAKLTALHTIFDVSQSIQPILGYVPTEMVGMDVSNIIPVGIRQTHDAGIMRFEETKVIRSPKTMIVTKVLHRLGHEVNVGVLIRPERHRDFECMKVKVFLIDDVDA